MRFRTKLFSDQQSLQGLLMVEGTECHVAPVAVIDPQVPR